MRYRPERIATVVRRIIGEAIVSRLADPRISHLASVTRVRVSEDLSHADVYVSVIGEASEAVTTLRGLESAQGRLQSMVAAAMAIRQVPMLRFHLDESIKRGDDTLRLIEKSTAETRQREAQHATQDHAPEASPDNATARKDSAEKAGAAADKAAQDVGAAVDKGLRNAGDSVEKGGKEVQKSAQ
jgi:ribosome-binding factor A